MSTYSFRFIERWFPLVAESDNCLELDFICFGEILSSSDLKIDSELQVFNAANRWLCHNLAERSRYSIEILVKIRIPLLSAPALKYIINEKSCLSNNNDCARIMNEVLVNKTNHWQPNKFSNISRHCKQNNFQIIVCGGTTHITRNILNDVRCIEPNNFDVVNTLPQMTEGRKKFEAICIKGEVYVFGGLDYYGCCIMSIEKYSPSTKAWNTIADMYDDRKLFSACSFMDNVYIIGGYSNVPSFHYKHCVEFNTRTRKWKKIATMNVARMSSACSVFEGRVVVSGGYNSVFGGSLDTVLAYDHIDDSWSNLPNMNLGKRAPKSVAINSKLFVIGGYPNRRLTCEVFDSICNKFVLLKSCPVSNVNSYYGPFGVFSIGNKLVIFVDEGKILVCDTENFEWSKNSCEAMNGIWSYSCAVLPQL